MHSMGGSHTTDSGLVAKQFKIIVRIHSAAGEVI